MELLAPVGSISALKAAINAGTDAVYLGLSEHNARIRANDFNAANLKQWVEYAHLFGVKVHVTLNTAVKNEEFDRVLYLAKTAVECGADALIVSDLGLVSSLTKQTDIPIHLSTQAGTQNALDARFARSLGVSRVILARETIDEDIPAILREIPETECFVQGALCVSFSGGCLLGSIEYGCSGNRGVCNQACRMRYTALNEKGEEIKSGYLLSPYDLCRGEDVKVLRSMGVDSIKIEGRLKRAVYVYHAVSYYRAILDGKDPSVALENLKRAFHRGFTKGYTLRKSDPIINTRVPTHIGVKIGVVEKVVARNGYKYAFLKSTYALQKGDGAKILRDGVEVGGSDVTSVKTEGDYSIIPVSDGVNIGDEVRLTTDIREIERVERIIKTLPIDITVSGKVGSPLIVTATYGDVRVSTQSDYILDAGKENTNTSLKEKISKLGNTDFCLGAYSDLTEGTVFLPVSEINESRRRLTASLRDAIIARNTPSHQFNDVVAEVTNDVLRKNRTIVEIEEPMRGVDEYTSAYVLNLHSFTRENVEKVLASLAGKLCYLRLPKIARACDVDYIERVMQSLPNVGIYTDSMYGVQLARELGRKYIVGFGMNVFNRKTAALFRDADHVCSSVECLEAGDLLFAGGKIPLMSFAHCPVSVACGNICGKCDRSVNRLYYVNGGRRYLIRRNEWRDCCFTMYQDKLSARIPLTDVSRYYSFVGASPEEKKALLDRIKEERSCIKA